MLLIRASIAETVTPIKRSGSESNHTKGHTTRASKAMGQLSTNRMVQPISSNSAFMGSGVVGYNGDGIQRHQCGRLQNLFYARTLSHRVKGHQHGAIGDHGQQGGQSD